MSRPPKRMDVACVKCSRVAHLGKTEALRAGWDLWLGGGVCQVCNGKERPIAPMVEKPEAAHFVRCSECARMFCVENEHVGGYHPGIHWVVPTLEQRADARAGRVPLPLCPGWNRPGDVGFEQDAAQ